MKSILLLSNMGARRIRGRFVVIHGDATARIYMLFQNLESTVDSPVPHAVLQRCLSILLTVDMRSSSSAWRALPVATQSIQERVESLLRTRFGNATQCRFETLPDGKLMGEVISPQFTEMEGLERQKQIWEALDQEFQADAPQFVSVLLAYTPEEWDMPLEGFN